MNQWMAGMAHFFMQYGVFGLFVLSFVEASFFPVPPYLLSIPMTLAKPQLGFFYALVGTVGSVLGGLFGYALGYRLGRPLLGRIVKPTVVAKIEAIYQRYGDWATAVGGLTPLPYKIFSISAGVFRTRIATFIPASLAARGIRFFGEALLLILYGRKVLTFLESAFSPTNLIILAVLSLIIVLAWHTRIVQKKLAPAFNHLHRQWLAWTLRVRNRFLAAGLFSWYLITGATITAFGFLIFSKIAVELLEHELASFDRTVGGWIINGRTDWLTPVMFGLTDLGSTAFVIGMIALITGVGIYFRKMLFIVANYITITGALVLTELLKGAFHRQRPPLPWLAPAGGYSFPSGHSLISLTLYGFLAYWIFRNISHSRWRILVSAGFLLLPILIGISRVYLGVHYPTDVLAGWAVAAGWIGTCMVGMEYLSAKYPSQC